MQEHYNFCYEVIAEYSDTMGLYDNFKNVVWSELIAEYIDSWHNNYSSWIENSIVISFVLSVAFSCDFLDSEIFHFLK